MLALQSYSKIFPVAALIKGVLSNTALILFTTRTRDAYVSEKIDVGLNLLLPAPQLF